MNKKFWAATFTLSGSIIGAGILGLPYVFSRSGFLIGLFWLVSLGIIMTFVNLCLGEVTLRTKEKHQLTGYAKKYLGPKGKKITFIVVAFGIYSALLAYLVGESKSISQLIPGQTNPLIIGILFWLIMTLLLKDGLEGLKRVETYGVLLIILIIFGLFIPLVPEINPSNLSTINIESFSLPIGVVLFSLLGFTAIPELRKEIFGQESLLKKAIIFGSLIPIMLYAMFSASFLGVLGDDVNEIATLSFGPIITLLGIFTMFTSYLVLSYALKDTYKYDFRTSKITNFILTSLLPLGLFILVFHFNLLSFSSILGIAGVISAGFTGIIILLMNQKSKKSPSSKKNIKIIMPMNWKIITLLSLLFLVGIILQFSTY